MIYIYMNSMCNSSSIRYCLKQFIYSMNSFSNYMLWMIAVHRTQIRIPTFIQYTHTNTHTYIFSRHFNRMENEVNIIWIDCRPNEERNYRHCDHQNPKPHAIASPLRNFLQISQSSIETLSHPDTSSCFHFNIELDEWSFEAADHFCVCG